MQDFPLFSFLALMTLGYAHAFCPLGRMESPEYLICTRGKIFQPDRRKHVLKSAESHRCEVNAVGKLACNINTSFKVSPRDSC